MTRKRELGEAACSSSDWLGAPYLADVFPARCGRFAELERQVLQATGSYLPKSLLGVPSLLALFGKGGYPQARMAYPAGTQPTSLARVYTLSGMNPELETVAPPQTEQPAR